MGDSLKLSIVNSQLSIEDIVAREGESFITNKLVSNNNSVIEK